MEKLPPLQKIYEAWSALADGRVEMEEGAATVTSSNGAKRYQVSWEGDTYSSNDNASYWQGYAGYPVLAVLMEQGRLPFDRSLAKRFSRIDWNRLNSEHRRDYAAAAQEAFGLLGFSAAEEAKAKAAAEETLGALRALPIAVKRKGRPAR